MYGVCRAWVSILGCAGAAALSPASASDQVPVGGYAEAARFAVVELCPAVMNADASLIENEALSHRGFVRQSDVIGVASKSATQTPKGLVRSDEEGHIQVLMYGTDACDVMLSGPALGPALPVLKSALDSDESAFEEDKSAAGVTYVGDPYSGGTLILTLGPAYEADIQPTIKASFVRTKD